jgi:cobalt-zinc-cadmium efflux system outer membrane protein
LAAIIPNPVAAAPPIWAPQPLAVIIGEGLDNNKEIQSLESLVDGLREDVSVAGSLNDPRVGFGLANIPVDTFKFDRQPMTQKQLFIAQKIPWFGKRGLRSQRAATKVTRQEAMLSGKRLMIARMIASAYYDLGFVNSSQEINGRLFDLVSQLLKVSETRYATGRGLQQDVFHAQVELSKLLDDRIVLDKRRRVLEDRINELLNRNQFTPVEPPDIRDEPKIVLSVEVLNDQALKHNPQLQLRNAEIRQAWLDIELARKDYRPDVDFKVAYGQRDSSDKGADWVDFASASVVMNIPLWHKTRQDKKLSATQARHRSATTAYESVVSALPHRIDALIKEIEATGESYRLLEDVLMVQAAQWSQSSLSAYEVGRLEFSSMVTAQLRLLRVELTSRRYLYTIYKKRAELEEILGAPLPDTPADMTLPDVSSGRTEDEEVRILSAIGSTIEGSMNQ